MQTRPIQEAVNDSGSSSLRASDVLRQEIVRRLNEVADILELQGAKLFRVNAYRRTAGTIAGLRTDLAELVQAQGIRGLMALPNIGKGIATAIYEMVATGRWSQLERLRGTLDAVRLFQTVPGIGGRLAERIHDVLHIDTLEQFEAAAHDGRLADVPGIGGRRLHGLQATLAAMLGRRQRVRMIRSDSPAIADLLAVDREYRERAERGDLSLIAPKRFNPGGEAWLPIMHTRRGGWFFTTLYSNTALAHRLGRTHDWVVVYFYDHEHEEGQHTIVTETHGILEGRRVVRGREAACLEHYRRTGAVHGDRPSKKRAAHDPNRSR